jgi:hypothetical protein
MLPVKDSHPSGYQPGVAILAYLLIVSIPEHVIDRDVERNV